MRFSTNPWPLEDSQPASRILIFCRRQCKRCALRRLRSKRDRTATYPRTLKGYMMIGLWQNAAYVRVIILWNSKTKVRALSWTLYLAFRAKSVVTWWLERDLKFIAKGQKDVTRRFWIKFVFVLKITIIKTVLNVEV